MAKKTEPKEPKPKNSLFAKLFSKFPGANQNTEPDSSRSTPVMKLVVFIVDWDKAPALSDLLVEDKVRFHFIIKGTGAVTSEILDLLGIGAGNKAVVVCLEQEILVPVLMKEARKKLGFYIPGQGIAFTIPLSAINDPVLLVFKQSILKNEKIAEHGSGNASNDTQCDYVLVVSIINHGCSDQFMITAREAGATGGTIINARGQFHEGAVHFFGISLQHEKEVIFILVEQDKKEKIMQTLFEAHGPKSEAQGIVFSLPVDNVMGLSQ